MQCRKGIPSALRARCWPLLCGAHVCQKNSPGTYEVKELARVPRFPEPLTTLSPHTYLPAYPQKLAEAPGDPQWMETIGRDLHRQFPLHEMFVSPQGHGYEASDAQGPPASQPQAFWPSATLTLCLCISGEPAKLGVVRPGQRHQRGGRGARRTDP